MPREQRVADGEPERKAIVEEDDDKKDVTVKQKEAMQ